MSAPGTANGVRLHVITGAARAPAAPVLYSYNRDDEQLAGAFAAVLFPLPLERVRALADEQYAEAEAYVLAALAAQALGREFPPLPGFLQPPEPQAEWPSAGKVAGEYVPEPVAAEIRKELKL